MERDLVTGFGPDEAMGAGRGAGPETETGQTADRDPEPQRTAVSDDIRARLARLVERDADRDHTRDMDLGHGLSDGQALEGREDSPDPINARLRALLDRDDNRDSSFQAGHGAGHYGPKAHDVDDERSLEERGRSDKDRDRSRSLDDDDYGWGL